MFDFKHIKSFTREMMDLPGNKKNKIKGPMVLFATPGMLHSGMSLEVFKKWGINEKNTIIFPG
jgi:integrator complex subunit 11